MNYNLFDQPMMTLPVYVVHAATRSPAPTSRLLRPRRGPARSLLILIVHAAQPDRPYRRPGRSPPRASADAPGSPADKEPTCPSASKSRTSTSTTASSSPSRASPSPSSPAPSPPSSARPAAASRRSCARSTACTRSSPAPTSRARCCIDGNDLYAPGVDPVLVRRQVGMVFQRPNPFPTMSIRDNVLAGVKLNNTRISKADADDLVEKSLRGANLWNEVKDRLDLPGTGPLRRPAAAPLHRARDRGLARGAADGRAVLGPRPDLDARDRGPDRGAEAGLHDRHRDPQHAAGRRGSPTTPPSSTSPAPASRASSSSTTTRATIFSKPTVQATEDYVSGRFG